MFSVGTVCRAALASHRPVLASSVSSRGIVKRLVGDRGNRTPNISAINSIITKTKGQGLPGTASVVGRAAFYVRCKNPEAAIEEIDKILPEIKDSDLRRLAIGIRLQARNDVLDMKEAALRVDGGTTEIDVSTLRSALRQDYEDLKAASPGCWLVEMAAAEYCLYEGDAEKAYDTFRGIEAKIKNFIASLGKAKISTEVASGENIYPPSLLAFQLTRAHDTKGLKPSASKLLEESIKSIVEDESLQITFSTFKKDLGISVTDEEAVELAYILEAAHIHHHFHDYFPLDGEYNDWGSEKAKEIKEGIIHIHAPSSAALDDEMLEKVRKSVPPQPFYAPEEELRKFLSSSSGSKNHLAELRAKFGPGPEGILAKADESYFEAMKVLKAAPVSANAAGDESYAVGQNEISRKLAQQLLYRTQVSAAVALTQLDRLTEAMEILNKVIRANEYIYMWRAYLARGEANKRLGLISNSDKDFRQLSGLKKSLCHDV
ncbi:succinate dehydrogenase flavoprotein subunit [Trypanosoma grayi]|uniref:succinate dehydrogenase flavoprotein subunit n=1 Tax=Trypanosoma grayi TaxID=71804 RepID=UPI0004F4AFD7|nr:succinate dehydrogenase flavoprotein subunit [Trypanosoma grayi]KEG13895.1 succinate dehydrogenase flavoprotein subunit [Trypanosoma grayi]